MTPFHFLNDDHPFVWENPELLSDWLTLVADQEKQSISELSFIYCSDKKLLEVNKKFLSHDYYTDIITFNLSDHDSGIEGEVYISIDRVIENAKLFATSFEHELSRVHVHGLLHLLGYDDHSDSEQQMMRNKENHYLSLLPEVPRGTF